MENDNNPELNRRRFLSGTATLAVSGALQGVLATPSSASEKDQGYRKAGTDYDVIIIGGGFAGVTAAREMGLTGFRTLLLEARPRLGGLTFTSKFAGQKVELGGTWVHWLQPHIWSEMQRYGLGVSESPVSEPTGAVLIREDGSRKEYPPAEMMMAMAEGFESFCYDAAIHFPRPFQPLLSDSVRELDRLSMLDRLNELKLPAEQKELVSGLCAALVGLDLEKAGLSGILKSFACAGWNFPAFMDTQSHYKIKGGTIALINAMIEDSGAEVQMATPVEAIRQTGNKVLITTDEEKTISASAVIITAPLNTYQDIEFEPALSAEKQKIATGTRQSQGVKIYAHIKQDIGQFMGVGAHQRAINVLQTEHHGKGGTIMVGLGANRELLDINDNEMVAAEINAFLPEVEVLGSTGYDWLYDPYSRGTWPAYRVGEMSTELETLQKPDGRLFFAGGATANGWHEWMDGAIESGLRAGREVRTLLEHSQPGATF